MPACVQELWQERWWDDALSAATKYFFSFKNILAMQYKINFTEYLVKKIFSKRTLHYSMEMVNIL